MTSATEVRRTSIRGVFTHIHHGADLHIRRTVARAAEYSHVLGEWLSFMRLLQPVIDRRALSCLAGDLFEDKRALDPYAEQTFVWFVRELASLTPVVIIPGNHDFQQTNRGGPTASRMRWT
jgi:DNA repair exonuclease SbcCD nuclease subunit